MFDEEICLSWDETINRCGLIGLETVPVLHRGPWDEMKIKACWTGVSEFGALQEGYVVRNAGRFPFDQFASNTAKFVRSDHVTSDEHWLNQPLVRNRLISEVRTNLSREK